MRELLFGGIIYMTGVTIVLIIKPQLFFNKEGRWKEFGIGRNPESYTWFPLWLFCIFWALVSYSMVYLLIRTVERPGKENTLLMNSVTQSDELPPPMARPRRAQHRGLRRRDMMNMNESITPSLRHRLTPAEDYGNMKPGVYVINEAASSRKGIPHYVYYGPNDNI